MSLLSKIAAKISFIKSDETTDGNSQKTKTTVDSYAEGNEDGYQKIVAGKNSSLYIDRIRSILADEFGLNDEIDTTEHSLPYIPDLEKDIFKGKNQGIKDNMAPVVSRYAALEKMIIAQIAEARKTLNSKHSSKLSVTQTRDLQTYIKDLGLKLADCRKELAKAKVYRQWEIANKEASKDKI